MTVNHCYWKYDCEHYCTRQVEKGVLESHSWKQRKASTSGSAMTSQNKANPSLAASSTNTSSSKPSLFSTSKKQSNSPQMNLSSKLANNSKLTSDKCKKHLKNNLCLYYGIENYKLNSCPKKQTMVTSKSHNALATASKKPLEK